jgi:DNA-binding XRE family transcriptional regulator
MIEHRVTKKKAKPSAEVTRLRKLRDRFQREKPGLDELLASGEYTEPVPQSELLMMLELAAELKKARTTQGLSLATVAKRSGIDKEALRRIEAGMNTNPPISTLELIARCVGARLTFQLDLSARGS